MLNRLFRPSIKSMRNTIQKHASSGDIKYVHKIIQGCAPDKQLKLIELAIEIFILNGRIPLAKEMAYYPAYKDRLLDLMTHLIFVFAKANKLEQVNEIICENQEEDYINRIKLSALNGYVCGEHFKMAEDLLNRETYEEFAGEEEKRRKDEALKYICLNSIVSIIYNKKLIFLKTIESFFKDKPALIDIHGEISNHLARYGYVEACNALLAQYERNPGRLDIVMRRAMLGYTYVDNISEARNLENKYRNIQIPNSSALHNNFVAFLWNAKEEHKKPSVIREFFERARDENEKNLLYSELAYIAPQINHFDLVISFLGEKIIARNITILEYITQGIALSRRLTIEGKKISLLTLNEKEDNAFLWYKAMREFALKHDLQGMKIIFDSSSPDHHDYYFVEMAKILKDQMKDMTEEGLLKLIVKFNINNMQGFKLLKYTDIISDDKLQCFERKVNKIQEIMKEFSWGVNQAYSAYTLWSIPLHARLGILRLSLHGELLKDNQVLVFAYLLHSAEKAKALYNACLDRTFIQANCTLFNSSLQHAQSPLHQAVRTVKAIKEQELMAMEAHEAEKIKAEAEELRMKI